MSYGYTLLSESWPVARKQHRCVWCGQAILAGEKYRRERSVYDGEMQDHKWHPECDEQFGIECAYEGGTLEFTPHDNERPALGVAVDRHQTFPPSGTATPSARGLMGEENSDA